jgi:hypothetical protein
VITGIFSARAGSIPSAVAGLLIFSTPISVDFFLPHPTTRNKEIIKN